MALWCPLGFCSCTASPNSPRFEEHHQASGASGNPEPLQIRVASDESQVPFLVRQNFSHQIDTNCKIQLDLLVSNSQWFLKILIGLTWLGRRPWEKPHVDWGGLANHGSWGRYPLWASTTCVEPFGRDFNLIRRIMQKRAGHVCIAHLWSFMIVYLDLGWEW